jgi:hypothetical protein
MREEGYHMDTSEHDDVVACEIKSLTIRYMSPRTANCFKLTFLHVEKLTNLPVNTTGLLLTQLDTRRALMGTLVNAALHHIVIS